LAKQKKEELTDIFRETEENPQNAAAALRAKREAESKAKAEQQRRTPRFEEWRKDEVHRGAERLQKVEEMEVLEAGGEAATDMRRKVLLRRWHECLACECLVSSHAKLAAKHERRLQRANRVRMVVETLLLEAEEGNSLAKANEALALLKEKSARSLSRTERSALRVNVHAERGRLLFARRAFGKAFVDLEEVVRLLGAHADAGKAQLQKALANLALCCRVMGRKTQARAAAERALKLAQMLRDEAGQAHLLTLLSDIADEVGNHSTAIAMALASVRLTTRTGYAVGSGAKKPPMGDLHASLMRLARATPAHLRATADDGEAEPADPPAPRFDPLAPRREASAVGEAPADASSALSPRGTPAELMYAPADTRVPFLNLDANLRGDAHGIHERALATPRGRGKAEGAPPTVPRLHGLSSIAAEARAAAPPSTPRERPPPATRALRKGVWNGAEWIADDEGSRAQERREQKTRKERVNDVRGKSTPRSGGQPSSSSSSAPTPRGKSTPRSGGQSSSSSAAATPRSKQHSSSSAASTPRSKASAKKESSKKTPRGGRVKPA